MLRFKAVPTVDLFTGSFGEYLIHADWQCFAKVRGRNFDRKGADIFFDAVNAYRCYDCGNSIFFFGLGSLGLFHKRELGVLSRQRCGGESYLCFTRQLVDFNLRASLRRGKHAKVCNDVGGLFGRNNISCRLCRSGSCVCRCVREREGSSSHRRSQSDCQS